MADNEEPPCKKRAFPELPPSHPLQHLPMTLEHGTAWLNCPFAADCCVLVGGSHFFLHAAYVERDSDYFKGWLASGMSISKRFDQPLEGLLFPQTFSLIIGWIYTRKQTFLEHHCLFEIHHTGNYLGMKQDFFDLLLEVTVQQWCTRQQTTMWLSAAMRSDIVQWGRLQALFSGSQDKGKPIERDFRLRVLMHWARCFDKVDEPDKVSFKDEVNATIHLCTIAGIQEAMKLAPATFDIAIKPSTLLQCFDSEANYPFQCSRCHVKFASVRQSEASRCTLQSSGHSADTFVSKAGNTCCSSCLKPLTHTPCKNFYNIHTLITTDGNHQVSKRKESDE